MKKKLILITLIALLLNICRSYGQTLSINIYNANLKKWDPPVSKDEYAGRVKNIARKIAEKDNNRRRAGNLFGLVEAYWEDTGWWTKTNIKKPIPCPQNGGEIEQYTHDCFYNKWLQFLDEGLKRDQIGGFGEQWGDVAILATSNIFELESGTNYIKERIGPGGWHRLKYKLIGARLRLKGTNFVLPFYVVHLNTQSHDGGRQTSSCKDIRRIVKDNWVRGDLTPIVVGDFNFPSDHFPYGIMSEDFYEVGINYGYDDIEHIWIGKEASFPGTIGALRAINYDDGDEFDDDAVNLTDHNIPYVELILPKERATLEWWDNNDFTGTKHTKYLYSGDHGKCLQLVHNDAMKSLKFYAKPGWILEIYDSPSCSKSDDWGKVTYPSYNVPCVSLPKIGRRGVNEVDPPGCYEFHFKNGLAGKVSAIRHYGP